MYTYCTYIHTYDTYTPLTNKHTHTGSNVIRRLTSMDETDSDPEYSTLEQLKENLIVARKNKI